MPRTYVLSFSCQTDPKAASVELDTAFQLARDARKAVRQRHDNAQNAYRAQHAKQAQNNDQA